MTRTFYSKWVYTTIFIIFFISTYNISVQFLEIKCAEHDHTLETVNTEFETTTSRFSKLDMNTCFHHVYNRNTSRTTWKHCDVYRENRGCPRGHILVTHWSKNALLRNLPGEAKRAVGPIYGGTRHGGQHDSDLSGFRAGLQRSIITYTYNIVPTVLLCTQLI